MGTFFSWYGKDLCGGEERDLSLVSECLKLVKVATGLLFTMITSTPLSDVDRSPPQNHGPELLRKRPILSENPFHVDLVRSWTKLLR